MANVQIKENAISLFFFEYSKKAEKDVKKGFRSSNSIQ